jgi:hypothetical protein
MLPRTSIFSLNRKYLLIALAGDLWNKGRDVRNKLQRTSQNSFEFSTTSKNLSLIVQIFQAAPAMKSFLLSANPEISFFFLGIKIGHLVGHHLPTPIQVHIHTGEQSGSAK